jgi:predicted MFS family arabinose efflux permease
MLGGIMSSDSLRAAQTDRIRGANHRWKVLGVGFAANASFSAAFSGIPTTAVFLRSGYHVGNSGLGLVLGMLGLGIALSELPWGLLTDRWGDRRVLLLGLGTTAAALALMCLVLQRWRSACCWSACWAAASMVRAAAR